MGCLSGVFVKEWEVFDVVFDVDVENGYVWVVIEYVCYLGCGGVVGCVGIVCVVCVVFYVCLYVGEDVDVFYEVGGEFVFVLEVKCVFVEVYVFFFGVKDWYGVVCIWVGEVILYSGDW